MALTRKEQPWGVRTIYRSGRSILVGPYRGRQAAVAALLTGNGRVRESKPVFIGLGLRDSTGPVRILRERWLGFGDEDFGPDYSFTATGQDYELQIDGAGLDQVQSVRVTYDDGSGPQTILFQDPTSFMAQSAFTILLASSVLGNAVVSRVELFTQPNGASPLYDGADLSVPIPGPDVIDAVVAYGKDINAIQIEGSGLDQVFRFAFSVNGSAPGPFVIDADDTQYVVLRTSGFVQIVVPGWEDSTLTNLELRDENDNVIESIAVVEGVMPHIEAITSPATATLDIEGARLAAAANTLYVQTDTDTYTYYNPAGPDAAGNDLDVTIVEWSATHLTVLDERLAGQTVQTVTLVRPTVNSPSASEFGLALPILVDSPTLVNLQPSNGQAYQVLITGTDLDAPSAYRYRFVFDDNSEEVYDRGDTSHTTSVTPIQVTVYSQDFAGRTLVSMELLDSSNNVIDTLDFQDVTFPRADSVTAPDVDQLQIDGELLVTEVSRIQVTTDQGTYSYYDPNGPFAASNPPSATILVWTDSQIVVEDTQWTAQAPVTVTLIEFIRGNNSTAGFVDTNLVLVPATNFQVTDVQPYGLDEPSLFIQGSDLDQIEVFRFVGVDAAGSPLTLEYHYPADVANFINMSGPSAIVKDLALRGTRIDVLHLEDEQGTPVAAPHDVSPDVPFADFTDVASPTFETLHIDGARLNSVDRLEVNDGSYVFYNPAGPNAGNNGSASVTWGTSSIQVTDANLGGVGVYKVAGFRDDTGLNYPVNTPMDELDGLTVDVPFKPVVQAVVTQGGYDEAQYLSVQGQYLDGINHFRFDTAEGDLLDFFVSGTPGDFAGPVQEYEALIHSTRLHGYTLETLTVYDANGVLVQTFDISPDIVVARIDDVTSPADETLRIEGANLLSADLLEVTTDTNYLLSFYNPAGPNAATPGTTIITWTDTLVEVSSTDFTVTPNSSVTSINVVREPFEPQFTYPVDPAVLVNAVPEQVVLTSVEHTQVAASADGSDVDGLGVLTDPVDVYVYGTNMDLVQELEFEYSGAAPAAGTTFGPGSFIAQDETYIRLQGDFAGAKIDQIVARKQVGGGTDAVLDVTPDLAIPLLTDMYSSSPNRVRITGEALDLVDALHYFDQDFVNGGYTVYDPNGPNAGSNVGQGVTVHQWTDQAIEFSDTKFTSQLRDDIGTLHMANEQNQTTLLATFTPAVAVQQSSGALTLDEVNYEPHTAAHPFRLVLNGSGLTNIQEVSVVTDTGTVVLDTTNTPGSFASQDDTSIVVQDVALQGKTLTSVSVAENLGGPADATLPIDSPVGPGLNVPDSALSSPQPSWVMVAGNKHDDVDRFDVEVPGNGGNGPTEWVTYYGPTHPDFASNPPQVQIMRWDNEFLVVKDSRYTFDNLGYSPVSEFRVYWSWNALVWEDDVNVAVTPGYTGPIQEIHSVPTDRHGLAILGTGLDLVDVISVQGCGNGSFGDGSPRQVDFGRTEYHQGDPEVVSWTASQIVIDDDAAFSQFSGFVLNVAADEPTNWLPYWFVNYPQDDTPLVTRLAPGLIQANFWRDVPSGTANVNVYNYQIDEAQYDGLDRVEVDTVEEGTFVFHGVDSPNQASSTPGVYATQIASGIIAYGHPDFDDELTVTAYRAYRGNGALFYQSAPGTDAYYPDVNPTSLGGEVNELLSVNGDNINGYGNSTPRFQSDPDLFGYRLRFDDASTFDQPHPNVATTSPFENWSLHPELAGRTLEGVTPINAQGTPLAPEFTGTYLPFTLPLVQPLHVSGIYDYTDTQGDGRAQFNVNGNYLTGGQRIEVGSFDIVASDPGGFNYAGAFIATGLPGSVLGDAVLYDADDNIVGTGPLDVEWSRVDQVSGNGDGQSFFVDGVLLDGAGGIYTQWTGAETRYYYHPSGPDAGNNDPSVTLNWSDTNVQITDPYIASYYPGVTSLDFLAVQAPSGLGQFYSVGTTIDLT